MRPIIQTVSSPKELDFFQQVAVIEGNYGDEILTSEGPCVAEMESNLLVDEY